MRRLRRGLVLAGFVIVPVVAASGFIALIAARRAQPARSDVQCGPVLEQAARDLDSGLFRSALERLGVDSPCGADLEFQARRAEALALLDRSAEAEPLIQSVLERSPRHTSGLRARAAAAISNRQLQAAEATLGGLLQRNPGDTGALYLKALLAARRGQYNSARSGYLAVLRSNRRHVAARFGLVVLTSQNGVGDEARHHLHELLEIAPLDDERRSQAERWVETRHDSPNSRVLRLGED